MKQLQFSLANVLVLVIYAAACSAVATADSYLTLAAINGLVGMTLLGAVTAAVCSPTNRPFWCGFCGWGTVVLIFVYSGLSTARSSFLVNTLA